MQESPARHFNLAGASNFRDLGGYPAREGRTVRWRRIFRSNHLGHLTEADIGVLRDLGPALARAGDRAGALELYTREQQLLQAKNNGHYERDMQDVEKLIKDESDKVQARRAAEWVRVIALCHSPDQNLNACIRIW